jgi:hypothetical protein
VVKTRIEFELGDMRVLRSGMVQMTLFVPNASSDAALALRSAAGLMLAADITMVKRKGV